MRYFIHFYIALKTNRIAFILFILGCVFLITGITLLLIQPQSIKHETLVKEYV